MRCHDYPQQSATRGSSIIIIAMILLVVTAPRHDTAAPTPHPHPPPSEQHTNDHHTPSLFCSSFNSASSPSSFSL